MMSAVWNDSLCCVPYLYLLESAGTGSVGTYVCCCGMAQGMLCVTCA